MGDTSDNIPGVPGIGEKTATKIITAYGSIEAAHEHVDEIKPARAANNLREHYDMAVMSKKLAAIDTHVPIEMPETSDGLENFAMVVFPVPGGPYRMIELSLSALIAR